MAASITRHNWSVLLHIFIVVYLICIVSVTLGDKKKKKDIRDYNDADMERLFQEWEEDEEEKDPDDLMEHERPRPQIDISKIDPKNPESVLQMSKKGQTLMMFVSISGDPTKEESEKITQRWQDMLFNGNYQLQRYMVADDRSLFMVTDGSKAWEIKNFLIDQKRCKDVTIEGQVYNGRGSGKPIDQTRPAGVDEDNEMKKGKKKSGGKKKSDLKNQPPNMKPSKKDLNLDAKDNMVLLSEEEAAALSNNGRDEL